MKIGIIFAMIIILALRSGIVLNSLSMAEYKIYVYCVLGFCAGFSEKFVPSILESFINKSKMNPIHFGNLKSIKRLNFLVAPEFISLFDIVSIAQ